MTTLVYLLWGRYPSGRVMVYLLPAVIILGILYEIYQGQMKKKQGDKKG